LNSIFYRKKCEHLHTWNYPRGTRFPPETDVMCAWCGARLNDDGTWSMGIQATFVAHMNTYLETGRTPIEQHQFRLEQESKSA